MVVTAPLLEFSFYYNNAAGSGTGNEKHTILLRSKFDFGNHFLSLSSVFFHLGPLFYCLHGAQVVKHVCK